MFKFLETIFIIINGIIIFKKINSMQIEIDKLRRSNKNLHKKLYKIQSKNIENEERLIYIIKRI